MYWCSFTQFRSVTSSASWIQLSSQLTQHRVLISCCFLTPRRAHDALKFNCKCQGSLHREQRLGRPQWFESDLISRISPTLSSTLIWILDLFQLLPGNPYILPGKLGDEVSGSTSASPTSQLCIKQLQRKTLRRYSSICELLLATPLMH